MDSTACRCCEREQDQVFLERSTWRVSDVPQASKTSDPRYAMPDTDLSGSILFEHTKRTALHRNSRDYLDAASQMGASCGLAFQAKQKARAYTARPRPSAHRIYWL